MRKTLIGCISLLAVLGLTGIAEADPFTTAQTGDWSVDATWTQSGAPDSPDDTVGLSHATNQNIADLTVESVNFTEDVVLTLNGQGLTANTLTNASGKTLSGINLNGQTLTLINDPSEATNYAGRIYGGTLELRLPTGQTTRPNNPVHLFASSGNVGGSAEWTNLNVSANGVYANIGAPSSVVQMVSTANSTLTLTNDALLNLHANVDGYIISVTDSKLTFKTGSTLKSALTATGDSVITSYGNISDAGITIGAVGGTTNPTMFIFDNDNNFSTPTATGTPIVIRDGGRVRLITGAVIDNASRTINISGGGLYNTSKNGRLWIEAGAEVKNGDITIGKYGEIVSFGNITNTNIILDAGDHAPNPNYGSYLGFGDESVLTGTSIQAKTHTIVSTAANTSVNKLEQFNFETDSGLAVAFYNLDKNLNPTTFTAGCMIASENSQIADGTYIYLSPWTQYSPDGKTRTPRFVWSETPTGSPLEFIIAGVADGKTLTSDGTNPVDISKLKVNNIWLTNPFYTATPSFELRNGNKELWASLVIKRSHTYGEKATSPNNQSVAGALDELRVSENSTAAPLITALDASPSTGQFNQDLSEISPQSLLSAPFMIQLTQNASTRQFALYRNHRRRAAAGMPYSISLNPNRSGLADTNLNPGSTLAQALPETPGARQDREIGMDKMVNVFARATTSYTRMGSRSDRIGFDASTVGTVFGVDFKLHENIILGVGGSYNYIDIDLDGSRGGGRINSYRVGPYLLIFSDKWFFETEATIGFHNNKFGRKIQAGTVNEKANSKYDAIDFTVTLGTGYDFEIGGFTITPRTDIQYQYYNSDSFNERGAATSNLHVDSYENSSLISRFGVEIWKRFEFDHNAVRSMTPFVTVGYRREWLKPDDLRSRFLAGGSAFNTDNNVFSRNNIYIGAGTSVELTDQLNLDLKYQAEIGTRNTHTHDAYISLRYNF